MEWLLKIVDGPMKGAEIALVDGLAVSFGSDAACDIVVHDATVPAKACELEADAAGVRITVGGGSSEPLPAFEIRSFGTTSLAVGPVDGEWQSLVKPVDRALERADPAAEPPAEDAAASTSAGEAGDAETAEAPRLRRVGCILGVLLVLLLAAAGVLGWIFWPKIAERWPWTERTRVRGVEVVRGWLASWGKAPRPAVSAKPKTTLAEIAAQHHLTLTPLPRPVLAGNPRRRTERLAIRALALAADPQVKLALTDDETLLAAASELIFACSDGALKVEAASNRVVALSGYAPSADALERAVRALNADVAGIDRLDTSRVRVGGAPPVAVARTPFVQERLPGERAVVVVPAHTPEDPLPKKKNERDYPIAGILTVPYPCVVMRNGTRLVEGAQIGKAELVRIESDRLTLKENGRQVVWKP